MSIRSIIAALALTSLGISGTASATILYGTNSSWHPSIGTLPSVNPSSRGKSYPPNFNTRPCLALDGVSAAMTAPGTAAADKAATPANVAGAFDG